MMDGWDWFWGTLMMLVFWGGLAAVILVAIRASGGSFRRKSDEKTDAVTILEARFARGEISQEEFEERKRALSSRVA